jgi:hypothetical protein
VQLVNTCWLSAGGAPDSALLAPAGFGAAPPYKVALTNATFFLNTTYVTAAQAEASCVANGGHLATFASLAEQVGTHTAAAATTMQQHTA